MNEVAHTPGPWAANEGQVESTTLTNGQGEFKRPLPIARVFTCLKESHKQAMANARLIAAAPDLLAALEDILAGLKHAGHSSEHCHGGTCHYCAVQRKARAVIRKVTEAAP